MVNGTDKDIIRILQESGITDSEYGEFRFLCYLQ